ncbi:hypothetical protein RB195_018135 [Necator americanus]|uniref:Uncharacterized protein n=1 Tax=Necator americanus TaxID=51031 RepID=A0ABR1CAK1_NECAM
MDDIDGEYERFVEHHHDCKRKAKSFKTTKKLLSPEIAELIRKRGATRGVGIQGLTPELARLCREAIKEDPKGRREEELPEV